MTASVFTYWDAKDLSPLAEVIDHWSARVGALGVIGDTDVVRVLDGVSRSFIDTYERIRIPAARSDIARLAMLYDSGGLYIDSHCGVVGADIFEFLRRAQNEQIIFVDQSRMRFPRPLAELNMINAIIGGGQKSSHLLAILLRIIDNLEQHREYERAKGFKPYNLLDLTGPTNINALTLNVSSGIAGIRNDLRYHVKVEAEEDLPVKRYQFEIQSDSIHWSERQKSEQLFAT